MGEEKIYIINEKKFVLPNETYYIQYKKFLKIISEVQNSGFKLSEEGDKVELELGTLLTKLVEKDLLLDFFSILLVPYSETEKIKWNEEIFLQNKKDFEYITDDVAIEVTKDFFVKKTKLINDIMSYLKK